MRPTEVWTFRIVHPETGKPAPAVPVKVLDGAGNARSHLASDAQGLVEVPPGPGPRLRLRVGLRSEDPIELDTATLGDRPTNLAAPGRFPELRATPEPRETQPAAVDAVPPHIVYFQRLAMFAEPAPPSPPLPPAPGAVSQAEADFFALAAPEAAPFIVTVPHAGVWVTAQPHEPMQQSDVEGQQQAS